MNNMNKMNSRKNITSGRRKGEETRNEKEAEWEEGRR